MKKFLMYAVAAASFAMPALAALSVGDKAPDFTTQASLAGKEFTFSLADALKKGPVVLYFYPAAFTKGCTIEANAFATANDQFAALGATVIGMSYDNIETLNKFSVSECQSKFAVGSDADQKIMKAYDSVMARKPEVADRISYVISPEGDIIHVHAAMDPTGHVDQTMKAVMEWKTKQ